MTSVAAEGESTHRQRSSEWEEERRRQERQTEEDGKLVELDIASSPLAANMVGAGEEDLQIRHFFTESHIIRRPYCVLGK